MKVIKVYDNDTKYDNEANVAKERERGGERERHATQKIHTVFRSENQVCSFSPCCKASSDKWSQKQIVKTLLLQSPTEPVLPC